MRPGFLIIGATKSGTTTLFRALAGHPDIWIHPRKELRYFNEEYNWSKGPDWYQAQFAPAVRSGALICGESSNSYTRFPLLAGVPERIARINPDMKLLYVVRDPMKRIESHYRHRFLNGVEARPAEAAIRADRRYVVASLYGAQVQEHLRVFPRSQLCVIRAEELFAAPDRVTVTLSAFLGIDPDRWPSIEPANVTSERAAVPAPLRLLGSRFPAVGRCVKRLGWRLNRWRRLRQLMPASTIPFVIGETLRRDLEQQFAQDAAVLARLVGDVRLVRDAAPVA